jgi:hypothetical protein
MISLEAYSNPAQLWLAAAGAQGGDAPKEQGDQADLETRSLRGLIVEDEFFISLHTQGLLQALGHVVVAIAVSADQAVDIAERDIPMSCSWTSVSDALFSAGLTRRKASCLPSLCGMMMTRGSDIGRSPEWLTTLTSSRGRPEQSRSRRRMPA